MVLADSNIMIDYFRSRDSDLAKKIDTMDIGLCGAVRAEVIHGARSDYEIDNYLQAFKTFDHLINDDYDWEGTGFILQTLRSNGVAVPFADALIAENALPHILVIQNDADISEGIYRGNGHWVVPPLQTGCIFYRLTSTSISRVSTLPERQRATWMGMALRAARSSSDWMS